jgi:acyl carrier protein
MSIPESHISDDSSPQNIGSWDSFNGYVLLTELESEFNISFSIDEVLEVKTIKDIKNYLQKHGVDVDTIE